jgi:manganese/zinc/iron transport system substrate-binding protein
MDMQSMKCNCVVFGLVSLILVVLNGCGSAESVRADDGKIKIVCTVAMIGDVVKDIAAEQAHVITLLGPGTDPHGYKPTRDDIVALQNADIIFYAGLHLEGKMTDTLARLGQQKPVYALAEAIDKTKLLERDGAHDPHVWMDATLWARVVREAGRRLSEHDPDHAGEYTQRAEALAVRCEGLFAYGQDVMQTIPQQSRLLVTSHDAFNYFGRAYGIDVTGVQGISTESEANIKDINRLVDTLVSRGVKAVFVESSVAPKNVQAIIEGAKSRGHDVNVGGELFSDAMGAAGTYEGTYIGMIDHNITTVVNALGGRAPAQGWQGKLSIQSK